MKSRFKTYTTQLNERIDISENKSLRHYTIKTFYKDNIEVCNVYITYKMSKEEFNSCQYNNGNDWKNFLKSDDYFKTK